MSATCSLEDCLYATLYTLFGLVFAVCAVSVCNAVAKIAQCLHDLDSVSRSNHEILRVLFAKHMSFVEEWRVSR